MKVRQAIELARGLKQIDRANYPDLMMLQFLNECEGKLQTEFLHIADVDCQRYTEDDMEMDLIVGPPHDKLYYAYLCAMIDFTNGEYAKYNNSIIVANAFMAEWAAWFNRTHERDGRQYLGVFLSAYGIAVKHGYAGTEEEWLASLEGPAGPQGIQGEPGPQGAPGSVTFDELTEEQLAMLKGPEGPQGVPGIDGQDGIGIQFVEQTTTSTDDGGTNVVTVKKTDGTTSTFYVRNGSRGSTGPAGSDGQDGVSPTIGANGNWYVGKTDTGVAATSSGVYVGSGDMPGGYNLQIDPEGEETDFIPYIGSNGNWFVGNTDLEVPATGPIGPVGPAGATGPVGPAGSDGQDGVSPTIGDNGNWYLGDTDTGKPSRGETGQAGADGRDGADGQPGADGKSAYQYAQEGGYTGTEAEFAAKLAEEMPDKLPNPNALTFTGAVTGSYDGSAPLKVAIPSGEGGTGGGDDVFELIGEATSSGVSDSVGLTIPFDGSLYKTIIAYAYNLPAGNQKRLIIRTKKAWYNGSPLGWNALKDTYLNSMTQMNNTWGFFGAAIDVGGKLFTFGAAEANTNGGHGYFRFWPQDGALPTLSLSDCKFISLDCNSNSETLPDGCSLIVWGVRK